MMKCTTVIDFVIISLQYIYEAYYLSNDWISQKLGIRNYILHEAICTCVGYPYGTWQQKCPPSPET